MDNIGRKTRSKKNEKLENFLTDLQRLTIVHETDHNGSYYRFAPESAKQGANTDTNDHKPKGTDDHKTKGSKDKKDKKDGEKGKNAKEGDGDTKGKDKAEVGGAAAEGDKTMSDDHGQGRSEEAKKDKDKDDGPHMKDDSSSSDHTWVDRHD